MAQHLTFSPSNLQEHGIWWRWLLQASRQAGLFPVGQTPCSGADVATVALSQLSAPDLQVRLTCCFLSAQNNGTDLGIIAWFCCYEQFCCVIGQDAHTSG